MIMFALHDTYALHSRQKSVLQLFLLKIHSCKIQRRGRSIFLYFIDHVDIRKYHEETCFKSTLVDLKLLHKSNAVTKQ